MLPKIHRHIDNILASRLGADDLYYQHGESQYILVFDSLNETEARQRCRSLESAICRKLLGEGSALEGIESQSTVAVIDPDLPEHSDVPPSAAIGEFLRQRKGSAEPTDDGERARDRLGSLKEKLDRLLALLGHVEDDLAAGQASGAPSDAKAALLGRLERVTAMLRDTQQALATGGRGSPPAGAVEPGGAGPRQGSDETWDQLVRLLDQTLGKAREELGQSDMLAVLGAEIDIDPGESADATDSNAGDVLFSYQPVWQVRKQVLNAFVCGITMRADGDFTAVDSVMGSEDDENLIASVDRLILMKASADIQRAVESNHKNIIIVPVHFSTLSTPKNRRDYVQNCTTLREDCRQYLVFELIYPFVGVSNLPIVNAMAIVKPFCRAIVLRVGIDYPQFADLGAAGLYSAGTDLAECALGETELAAKINIFKTRTERSRLRSHLYGAGTLAIAVTAIGAGFDFLGRSAVAAPLDSLDGMQRFNLENLYHRRGIIRAE